MNEKEKMQKRLDNLQEDMWAMDLLAGELMEEKTAIVEQMTPLVSAVQNIEYKLTNLSQRKEQALIQYRLGLKVVVGIGGSAEAMEVV